jgi:hypothetical protein
MTDNNNDEKTFDDALREEVLETAKQFIEDGNSEMTPAKAVFISMAATEKYNRKQEASKKMKGADKRQMAVDIVKFLLPVVLTAFIPSAPVIMLATLSVDVIGTLIEKFIFAAKKPDFVDAKTKQQQQKQNKEEKKKKKKTRRWKCW